MKKLSVILLALVMAFAWTASAFADATPYASVRFQTFYKDTSGNDNGTDSSDLLFGLYATTRMGVKFKVSDEISGLVEMGYGLDRDTSTTANDGIGPYLRHAFGVYKFGAGELLIGQTWQPYAVFAPYVFDDSAGGAYGSAASRAPQVKLTFTPGVYVALVKSKLGTTDEEVDFPEIAIGYKGKFGDVAVGAHAAYVTADYTNPATQDEEGWVLAADVDAKVGPVKIGGRAFYGEDTGATNFGAGAAGGDLNSYGGYAYVTAYPSDKVAITGVVGYINKETTGTDDDDELLLAVNAPIKVTKGLTVVPEIAWVDGMNGSNGADDADSLYVGAKWQFDL